MSPFLLGAAAFLLLTLAGGLVRAVRGPTHGDRLIGAQLFGTVGTGFLLILGEATGEPALRHVALVLALLACVPVVAFVKRGWVREQPDSSAGRED